MSTWQLPELRAQDDAIEKKLHFNLNATMRGGWNAGVSGCSSRRSASIAALYADYRDPRAGPATRSPFVRRRRASRTSDWRQLAQHAPVAAALGERVLHVGARRELLRVGVGEHRLRELRRSTLRPTDKLRVNATYNVQSFTGAGRTAASVGDNRIPRLKVEYQLARPIFVRLVGEYHVRRAGRAAR